MRKDFEQLVNEHCACACLTSYNVSSCLVEKLLITFIFVLQSFVFNFFLLFLLSIHKYSCSSCCCVLLRWKARLIHISYTTCILMKQILKTFSLNERPMYKWYMYTSRVKPRRWYRRSLRRSEMFCGFVKHA